MLTYLCCAAARNTKLANIYFVGLAYQGKGYILCVEMMFLACFET